MERDLLEQLYHQYYRELYLYVYSLCRQRSMTEDVLQKTFLKAFLALKDSHTNMRAWLYLVARNLCFNCMKKERREMPAGHEEIRSGAAGIVPDAAQRGKTPDVLEKILQDERRRLLWEAIRRLDGRRQEILLLQYFGGFSQREIAAMLQLSPENVRIQAYRAKKELKSILEVMEYDVS